jgi:hypothetical protein
LAKIRPERTQALRFGGPQPARLLLLTQGELALRMLEFAQPLIPGSFEASSDQPILWFHGVIAPLGPLGVIAGALDGQAPLRQRGVVIGVELSRGDERGFQGGRGEGREKGFGHGRVDLPPPAPAFARRRGERRHGPAPGSRHVWPLRPSAAHPLSRTPCDARLSLLG